jgi:hypothetical protein
VVEDHRKESNGRRHPEMVRDLMSPCGQELAPLQSLSEKGFLCANSVLLCVAMVKIPSKNFIYHRGTEITQRTTEFFFRQTLQGANRSTRFLEVFASLRPPATF